MKASVIGGVALSGAIVLQSHYAYTHSPAFIYKHATPSIVSITSMGSQVNPFDPQGSRIPVRRGTGSGFIVAKNQLRSSHNKNNRTKEIVTNFHVVKDAEQITIEYGGNAPPLTFHIVKADPFHDIAILEQDEQQENDKNQELYNDIHSGLRLCHREGEIGEDVLAIGDPYGLEKSLSVGVISGLHRSIGNVSSDDMIQTDASINPGNSGGPLIALRDSCVIGMNTATIQESSGIGFAVSSYDIKRVLE